MVDLQIDSNTAQLQEPVSSVRFVNDLADMSCVYAEEANVVTLRRTPMDELIEEARRAANEIGSTRFEVRPDTVEAAAQPTLKEFPHLGNDIQIWVDVLGDLTGCDAVGVRMSRMTQAMCPRLHVDRVMLRLVMTYVGPGTEFVPEEHVDRRYLGGSGLSTRDEVGGLLRIPDCVQHARVFDLVALKGELWPENEGRGAVHRSPALDDAVSRFVMTLDPLYHD